MNRSLLKILIIEDDPVIAVDIKSLLKSEGFVVVGIAKNSDRALDLLHNVTPNFVLVDIHLGSSLTGIDIAKIIQQRYKIPYIFLTSFSDEITLEAAQKHAPYGYIVKPFHEKTLITTITTAWSIFQRLRQSVSSECTKLISLLTEKEKRICQELIGGASYNQISERLSISVNTLKYHVKNIYSKLEVSGRSELTALLHS